MISQIIFDCDGVLIDSEILSFAVDEQILPDYGVNLTAGELAQTFGGCCLWRDDPCNQQPL